MISFDDTINKTQILLDRSEWTKKKLSKEAGLGKNALRHIGTDEFLPSATTIVKLRQALRRIEVTEGPIISSS